MQKARLLGLKKVQSKPQPTAVTLTSPKAIEPTPLKNRSITVRADTLKYFTGARNKQNKRVEPKQALLSRTCMKQLPVNTQQPTKHKRNGSDSQMPTCQHHRFFNFERELEEQKKLVRQASSSVERAQRQFKTNSLKRMSFRKNLVAHSKIDLQQGGILNSPKPSSTKNSKTQGSISHRMARSFILGSSSMKKCEYARMDL